MSIDETARANGSVGSVQASGLPARALDWFWRNTQMRKYQRAAPTEQAAFALRAQLAADVARRTEDSAEPFAGSVDAILCDLYRQSIYWSRRSLGYTSGSPATPKPWSEIEPLVQQRAVPDALALEAAREAADSGTFERFAALSEEERHAVLPGIRALALSLLVEVEIDKRAIEALWTQRLIRLGLVFIGVALLAFVAFKASERAQAARDLAQGKPWRASSIYTGTTTCISPEQQCYNSPDFFFHTQEESRAWLEIDLQAPQTFTAVRVDNRLDCCTERAAPMVIEVSSDQKSWHRVARRDAVFTSWVAKFAAVKARYVRLRLENRESLHLSRVRVLR